MLIIPEEARVFLEKHLPEYKKYKTRRDLLIELDDLIVLKGLVRQEYPNEFGLRAQEIYDMIYEANS